jgi:hypothetical protein
VFNSSDIKLLTKSGEIKPFFSVSPLLTGGIHVTSDNYIIVGVTEPGESHTIMCPAVVVTTSTGLNCVVTFILECPVYVHLKPPSHPTTTTLKKMKGLTQQYTK